MNFNNEERRTYLGGSDSKRIMHDGDWLQLWKEKTGRAEPADLSNIVPVQMGIITESLNLDFLEKEIDEKIIRDVTIKNDSFMQSHLDGHTQGKGVPCEAKHTHEHNTMENVAHTYYAQIQHYLYQTAMDHLWLSIFFGNKRWEHTIIDYDTTYQKRMLKVLEYFWSCVEEDKEPHNIITEKVPPADIKLNGMTRMDFNDNIKWKDYVTQYKTVLPYVDQANACKTAIKDLVPDDAREVRGCGVVVARNKRNILTLKMEAEDDNKN